MIPTGSGYVVAGFGIKRDIEELISETGKSASILVVIHAPWPPVDYILRADILAKDATETKITTYNADSNKGQRSFHRQVQSWVAGNASDCVGMHLFD